MICIPTNITYLHEWTYFFIKVFLNSTWSCFTSLYRSLFCYSFRIISFLSSTSLLSFSIAAWRKSILSFSSFSFSNLSVKQSLSSVFLLRSSPSSFWYPSAEWAVEDSSLIYSVLVTIILFLSSNYLFNLSHYSS